MMELNDVTRVDVIDDRGVMYTSYGVRAQLDLQDDGRTLKVFVSNEQKEKS